MVSISPRIKIARTALVFTILPALMGMSETDHEAPSLPDVPEATWAVDPTKPGDDLPLIGYSLFDRLFAVEQNGEGLHQLPFPFTELVKSIEARLVKNSGRGRLKQVLIPLGRSLQRHTAAPDYFKSPRVVVAVDSEPDRPGDLLLKDRLFLGYQERANLIEVISYNEQAGRFEFQIVRAYGPNSNPQVFYARRAICISCHQNGGPIFSRAAWSETAANPKIASRLLDVQSAFFEIPVNRSAVDPFAIDSATDRANLLLPYQLLWTRGCGEGTESGHHCRAGAFTAALQYRLTSKSHFDRQSSSYRSQFLDVFKQNWSKQWPGGLKIPSPDIPNRDPVAANGRISADLDPLVPRPPLEIWSVHRKDDVDRMIKGVSESITAQDIRQLDTYLFGRDRGAGTAKRKMDSTCELSKKRFSESTYRMSFECGVDHPDSNSFEMAGRLYVDTDRITDGVIDALRLTDGTVLKRLGFPSVDLQFRGNRWRVNLAVYQQPSGLHARLPTGSALQSVELRWLNSPSTVGSATLSVMDDFYPVHAAIARLASRTKENPFSLGPFQAARTMRALFSQLGTNSSSPVTQPMPEAKLDSKQLHGLPGTSTDPTRAAGMQDFFGFCEACHRTTTTFPPNFLLGDADRVAANLAQCAPRIWYRLNMWQVPVLERPKSPMPPVTAVQGSVLSADRWLESNEFIRLRDYVAGLLKSRNVSFERLLHQDYEALPVCLPDVL